MRRTHLSLYVSAFAAAAIAAAAIYVAADILGVPVKILTRDPYRAAEVPPYFAYFSLLGSAIWLIAGTATLTTGLIARNAWRCRLSGGGPYRIIILGGIIGLAMALDDTLLFHDAFAGAAGVPEILFHIFYSIFIASMTFYSKDAIRLTPWGILFAALACFGLSSTIDLWRSLPETLRQSEDVFKFCAIVLWAVYFLQVSWDFVKGRAVDRARGV